jgi:hypothetical protein
VVQFGDVRDRRDAAQTPARISLTSSRTCRTPDLQHIARVAYSVPIRQPMPTPAPRRQHHDPATAVITAIQRVTIEYGQVRAIVS